VRSFVRAAPAQRIVFGAGTISEVGPELDRLNASRAVVLSTRGQSPLASRVTGLLGPRAVAEFPGAVPHTPVEVTEQAVEVARGHRADAVVAIGGGSTTGLGKAVASRLGIRHLVVPTTYAGSEVTPVLGETSGGQKTTRSAPEILPDTVVYDVELTTTLPWPVSVTSAINALAHAVEALYAKDATPATDDLAIEAIRLLVDGLPALRSGLAGLDARADLLYGGWLAGRCLGAVGMGLHHKLCHTLGGAFNLPHAGTHTVVLPYAMAYNAPAAPRAMSLIAEAIERADAPSAVQSLVRELGGPTSLREIGLASGDIDRAAELAAAQAYPNPRELTRAGLTQLLRQAYAGDPIRPS
jgi:alcohol dehydrogenase class IV